MLLASFWRHREGFIYFFFSLHPSSQDGLNFLVCEKIGGPNLLSLTGDVLNWDLIWDLDLPPMNYHRNYSIGSILFIDQSQYSKKKKKKKRRCHLPRTTCVFIRRPSNIREYPQANKIESSRCQTHDRRNKLEVVDKKQEKRARQDVLPVKKNIDYWVDMILYLT